MRTDGSASAFSEALLKRSDWRSGQDGKISQRWKGSAVSQPSGTRLWGAWQRVPVVVRALLLGFLIMNVGVYGYSLLVRLNLAFLPIVPWAAAIMVPLLWAYWQYLGGRWWPRATSEARARCLRARPLPRRAWRWVLLAGVSGIVFTLNFGLLWQRHADVYMDPSGMIPEGIPWWMLLPSLAMVSIVAGFCEEAGVRGYLQGMIERRHGVILAVAISAAAFTYAHFGHEWGVGMAVPFFVSSIWYGALTVIARSIWPMVAVHIGLDAYLFGTALFIGSDRPAPLSATGLDATFWATAAVAAAALATLVLALFRLSVVMRDVPDTDVRTARASEDT